MDFFGKSVYLSPDEDGDNVILEVEFENRV